MSARRQTLELRLELLRLRGQIARDEAGAALADLRRSTRGLRTLGGLAGSLAGAASDRTGGWLGVIADLVNRRPWLAALAVAALRSARRHPWLVLGVAAAVWATRRATADAHAAPATTTPAAPDAAAAATD